MISDIFQSVGDAMSAFATALNNGITAVSGLFYTTGENAGLTFLGTLLTIAIGVGVVYWVFGLIRGLISQRVA